MKPSLLYLSFMCILLLVSIACASVDAGVEWEPTSSALMPTALASQPISEGTISPTETVPRGGFITGTPVDVSTLPKLKMTGSDGGYGSCSAETTEPSLSLGPSNTLCLNYFPIAPNSPGVTVTLVDPAGRTFSESFTYSQDQIVNSRGEEAGWIEDGSSVTTDGVDFFPTTPGVGITLDINANLPHGSWLASAKTNDGSINIGPVMLTVERPYPLDSILSDLDINPFYNHRQDKFANSETIYFVGSVYPANTALTVAFYQDDLSGGTPYLSYTAKYAALVTTDNSGSFQAQFVVDNTVLRGEYYAVAAPQITSDILLSVFGKRHFIIE